MPLLASLLSGLFAALVEFFARYFTKKVALATAAVAAFGALTLALWAAVTVALAGIAYSFPGGSAVAVGVCSWFRTTAPRASPRSSVSTQQSACIAGTWKTCVSRAM